MTALSQVVQRFHRNLDIYKRLSYKEARVRVEFIDLFWSKGLGPTVSSLSDCLCCRLLNVRRAKCRIQ